jgi:hypothetical protein
MSTKVFTATATEMFTATAMAATAMAAPTALGHRRLSAQIYQRPERNGHRKYFDKSDCHRPLLCGKKTCARALSSISRHFALHSRRRFGSKADMCKPEGPLRANSGYRDPR